MVPTVPSGSYYSYFFCCSSTFPYIVLEMSYYPYYYTLNVIYAIKSTSFSMLTLFARIPQINLFFVSGQTTKFLTLKFSTAKIILFLDDFIVTTFILLILMYYY